MSLKDKWPILLILLVVALSCLPLFRHIQNINTNFDWLQMASFYRAARQCILEYHQFPFRTPYFAGGYPLIAHPLDGALNPFFIPVLIFGEAAGLKVNLFLFHLIGALGMYYLTRCVLKYNYPGALFSSFVFCLGGNLHRLLIVGLTYPPACYFFMPLLFALFIKAKENKKFIIYTVFLLAVMVTQMSLRFAVIILFLFLFSLLEIIRYQEKRLVFDAGFIANLAKIAAFTFLLGAVKIFPLLELLAQNPRFVEGYNPFWKLSFAKIYNSFLVHKLEFASLGSHRGYFYLGYLPLIFASLSFLIYWRKMKRLFILLVIFALLSFGAHTRFDLFRLLWPLPVFRSIEAPVRYFAPLLIFILALACGQIFSLSKRIKLLAPIFIIALIFTTGDLFWTNTAREEAFPLHTPRYTKQKHFFQVKNLKPTEKVSPLIPESVFLARSWEWTRPTQYELLLQNIGKINAYTNIHLQQAVSPKYYIEWNGKESLEPENYTWQPNPDYKGELYFLNHPQNQAEFAYFSPNKITARVKLVQPDILLINQNYDKYWHADRGKPHNHQGLLALQLDKKGDYPVTFTYMPVSFYAGLGVSLISLVLLWYRKV